MKVIAQSRSQQGTGASRRLRRSGKTPGIIYGAGSAPQLIALDQNALFHALEKEAFHASILDLELDGASQPVLLRDVQRHPFKPAVLHIDFQRVEAEKKIHKKVPLHYLNQEISKAVKLGGAIITHVMTEIEIICLPAHLPEFIEVDLSELSAGQSLHIKDVSLPSHVELALYLSQENPVILSATVPSATEEAGAESATSEGNDTSAAA
ncbi:50S ribosomal protein L25 (General stress protein CTC) [Candidatus Glomeribacter gigasporarum BEG34]|uniref:Large ribosomal subunit protein bL25 n=1 Tax=Candidatus Glomeribacter gigasporarum BEG34 TaxID=1070319 RepID=G2JAI4_9BURK|nr:50S ribosomal protein L25/general stress protein Ctc [Candidatus Glomeribacter gigasporarum]CCD29786.1 50S ribosomal protein L25 (General stress protein CTC) [Candidatus Glomeribacter gigasporarum BEG34]